MGEEVEEWSVESRAEWDRAEVRVVRRLLRSNSTALCPPNRQQHPQHYSPRTRLSFSPKISRALVWGYPRALVGRDRVLVRGPLPLGPLVPLHPSLLCLPLLSLLFLLVPVPSVLALPALLPVPLLSALHLLLLASLASEPPLLFFLFRLFIKNVFGYCTWFNLLLY